MPKENKIRVLYVQPGKYPEERIIENNLKSMQKLVDGDIEVCTLGGITLALFVMMRES